MKIVIFDPALARFGHHIRFNRQVLQLLDQDNIRSVYLDVEGIMQESYISGNVDFRAAMMPDRDGRSSGPLASEEFIARQKTASNCQALWAQVSSLDPDLVIVTSEGNSRKQLLANIPEELSDRTYLIVHAVWSIIRQLDSDPQFHHICRTRLAGMFALETFLVDKLSNHGIPAYWFPHRSYNETDIALPPRRARAPEAPLQIGTFGVINERRNNDFLIKALGQLEDVAFDYHLAGQLMPAVKSDIATAISDFRQTDSRRLFYEFGYMSEERFSEALSSVDVMLIAYDDLRTLQASGAVYSALELGVPLLAPDTALFRFYRRMFPGLIKCYPALKAEGLHDLLRGVVRDMNADTQESWNDARDRMILSNQTTEHRAYINALLNSLTHKSPEAATQLVAAGRMQAGHGRIMTAEGYLLAGMQIDPSNFESYRRCVKLRLATGDVAGAAHIRTPHLQREPLAYADLPNRPLNHAPFEILVWPPFESRQQMEDFLCRVAWHFAPIASHIVGIHIFTAADFSSSYAPNPVISEVARDRRDMFLGKIFTHPASALESGNWDSVGLSLIWKYDTPESRRLPLPQTKNTAKLYKKKMWRVDEDNERFATSHFLKAVSEAIDLTRYRQQSLRSLRRLGERFTADHVAIFGTGPSLSDAWKHDFRKVDTIAANSMVKNVELLDHLQPKLIVCADPIFHAGVSTYAEEFRRHLRFALKRYGCSLMVPERDRHIYEDYFSGEGVDILSAPFEKSDLPNYNLLQDLRVTSTGNILTLFLLQVAFSLADRVDIYGCDGRPAEENSYFWGHDKSAQLNEHMTDIQRAHPGFFKISYDEYYAEHCATLEKFLAHAEQLGKVAISKTFSHIPALRNRAETGSVRQFAPPEIGAAGRRDDHVGRLTALASRLLLDPVTAFAALDSDPAQALQIEEALETLSPDDPVAVHFRRVLQWARTRAALSVT